MTNQETQGILQSNYFVVGLREGSTGEFEVEGACLHITEGRAKEELKRIKSYPDNSDLELCVYHVKIIGTLEGVS